jgi:hypothetical protein
MEKLTIEHLLPCMNKEITEMDGELFKPYKENPQYLVSNFGRIKSKEQIVNHNYGGKAVKKERILTQTDNGSGYLSVGLTFNGKTKTIRVSRIVASTWVENPHNKPQVNHINGIKHDNRADNLEWCTSGENIRHAWNNGLAKKQSSFIYVQDRLSEINPYLIFRPRVKTPLGYGTIIIDQNNYRIEYDNGKYENLVKSLRFWKDDFKLILHNLSDLTKEIEVNGERFVPWDRLADKLIDEEPESFSDINSAKQWVETYFSDVDVMNLPYKLVKKLFEWHFDLNNLIEKGLAIDINTL